MGRYISSTENDDYRVRMVPEEMKVIENNILFPGLHGKCEIILNIFKLSNGLNFV